MANRLRNPHSEFLGGDDDTIRHHHVISAVCAELTALTGEELDFIARLCGALAKARAAFAELGVEPDLDVTSGDTAIPFTWVFDDPEQRQLKVHEVLVKIAAAREQLPLAQRNAMADQLRHLTGR